MEAILKFDLDDESKDDNNKLNTMMKAGAVASHMFELNNNLRSLVEWGEPGSYKLEGEDVNDIESLADKVREIINEGIDFDAIRY